jgi:Tol biopolymer transport system component/tRNA A-37 threonylcarbamoyl transferase component Bud32
LIGRTLSQFKITAKLGEGGMGVVYRARDTKLGRDVAIKVLPEELTADPERMARFEREARVLASLNHPSIAAIHDLKEADGNHFLVLELVEGEDLATVLDQGPIEQTKALHIALQLADALETTHNLGIVHRDLKPANIMVGPNDQIKVLDFGLAKAAESSDDDPDLTHSPTRTAPMTQAGLILGTAGYMSPEQARGQPVDKQADIWAFGVVLWEMLTGKPLIRGESIADMMVAVLKAEIDWDALPDDTPLGIRRLLGRCLQREPRQRLHNMGDARLEIEAVMEGEDEALPVAVAEDARSVWPRALAAAAVTAVLALIWILAGPGIGPSPPPEPVFRSDLALPLGEYRHRTYNGNIRLSPDGNQLLYRPVIDGGAHLAIHDFTTGESTLLAGTVGAEYPFWSPDGEWVAFFAGQQLRKIPADGGPTQIIADAPAGRGGAWGDDGTILFAPDTFSPLASVPISGGAPRLLTSTPSAQHTHRHPHFLPDGEHFLFVDDLGYGKLPSIAVGSLADGSFYTVLEHGSNPQFADGYLIFERDRNLMGQAFDLQELSTRGEPRLLATAIEHSFQRVIANFSVVPQGPLAYQQHYRNRTQITWFGRDGRDLGTVGEPGLYAEIVSISQDGSKAVIRRLDSNEVQSDLWTVDLETGSIIRATPTGTRGDLWGALSTTGDRLAVGSYAGSGSEAGVWLQSISGTGEVVRLWDDFFKPGDWTPDDSVLLGDAQGFETGFDIVYFDLSGPPKMEPEPLFDDRFDTQWPDLSPDGNWLAYRSNESGQQQLYVTDYPLARSKWLVSRATGNVLAEPRRWWSPDGGTLYYGDAVGIFEVSFTAGDPPVFGAPELILANDPEYGFEHVTAVLGDRILTVKRHAPLPELPVRLIHNWQQLLED